VTRAKATQQSMKKGKTRAARVLREERVPYLTDQERESLARFLERLEAECSDRVQRVVLFGSRARGDHEAESDVDLLIVADADRERIGDLAHRATLDDSVPFSTLVISAVEYQRYQRLRLPIYVNLRREGIELWDEAQWKAEERGVLLDFVEGERRPMDEATRETIRIYLNRAHHSLRASRKNKADGFLGVAVSQAYYAAFYALTAALYALNIVRSKHSGVQAALSKFLVRPGFVEADYKDIYNRLREGREDSDYGPEILDNEEFAANRLAEAERFAARMEAFLREQGFEP
jgi:uncharacterized protein (UPF0332 family)/predicted nucleotidyltransferase